MNTKARHAAVEYVRSLSAEDLRSQREEWVDGLRDLVELEAEADGTGDPAYWTDVYPDWRPTYLAPLSHYPEQGLRMVKGAWRRHERAMVELLEELAIVDAESDRRGIEP